MQSTDTGSSQDGVSPYKKLSRSSESLNTQSPFGAAAPKGRFCLTGKASSNLFLRVYTGMPASKISELRRRIDITTALPIMPFGKNHQIVRRFTLSICGLLLYNFNAEFNMIAIVLIITQQTRHHCIRSFFPRLRINSILRHGKDSRSEVVATSGHFCLINLGHIQRIIDIRVSSLNFLKICLQNGPCFFAQRFVFDQIIRILVLLSCSFQCSLYCIFCLLRTAAAAAGPAARQYSQCQCAA